MNEAFHCLLACRFNGNGVWECAVRGLALDGHLHGVLY